jgi:hypothetical protein
MGIKILASIFISTSIFATAVLLNKKFKKQNINYCNTKQSVHKANFIYDNKIGSFYNDTKRKHLLFHKIINPGITRLKKNKNKYFRTITPIVVYKNSNPGLNIDEEFKNELINVYC